MNDEHKRLQAAYRQGLRKGYELGMKEAMSEGCLRAAYEDGICAVWNWIQSRLSTRRMMYENSEH